MSVKQILEDYRKGKIDLETAIKIIRLNNLSTISDIKALKRKTSEVPRIIYGRETNAEDICKIISETIIKKGWCIISHVSRHKLEKFEELLSNNVELVYHDRAHMLVVKKRGQEIHKKGGKVAIITGGISDICVAEETRIIAEEMGCEVITFYDIGEGSLHNLTEPLAEIINRDVDVVIVVAGMDGALPSIISGLIDIPVIGLPTSVTYGLGGRGISAISAMLQSCSPGISVVNIDNSYAAACMAATIANRVSIFRNRRRYPRQRTH